MINFSKHLGARGPSAGVHVRADDEFGISRADIVYVIGEVKRPGAYPLTQHENLTVSQAVALSQGLNPSAATEDSLLLRITEQGDCIEMPLNLGEILKHTTIDPALQPQDVIVVPNTNSKKAESIFFDDDIVLDGNRFVRCRFDKCDLTYSGGPMPTLAGCTFHEVSWTFTGAAANTLMFISLLYNSAGDGGRAYVEDLFSQVRSFACMQKGVPSFRTQSRRRE